MLESDLEGAFLFSITWSLGCALDDDCRKPFSDFLISHTTDSSFIESHDIMPALEAKGWNNVRKELLVPLPRFNDTESLYDYKYVLASSNSAWVNWKDTLPTCNFPTTSAFHEIVVPTVMTSQFDHIVRMFLLSNMAAPTLVCGPTGTGKR